MESSTTIKGMLAGNHIFVPSYQRAYSWEVGSHADMFLSDLEDYTSSGSSSSYYFGHFLFERKSREEYGVIDGQQRLTTIVIFLSALFSRLKSLRPLTESENESYEDMVKRSSRSYRFSTVGYDDLFFRDYVINHEKIDRNRLETESAKRIANAYDNFVKKLSDKDETYLRKMIDAIRDASCTTHIVSNESEAIQMFIFQNNRGKKPTRLEIIKAEFMYTIHLSVGEEKEKENLIEEIKKRFETIYKSISAIEHNLGEDEILTHTLRVYFNSLSKDDTDLIYQELSGKDPIAFIQSFTQSLTNSFDKLTKFFSKDEQEQHTEIHSLVTLGKFASLKLAIPFIIKAYSFALPELELCRLCTSLESLVLRDRLIGTRADLTSRISGEYQGFTADNRSIEPIVNRVNWIRNVSNESWWWSYWNNAALRTALQGKLDAKLSCYLLWRYENYLRGKGDLKGYSLDLRYDAIESPEREHISPCTHPDEVVASGYSVYDEEFRTQYLECIGNYLLISKSHNCSIGNSPFPSKYATYTYLEQQKEVRSMSEPCGITWTKDLIRTRKEKIITFIESHV
jgi:hypothetical protein